jgi:PD-(D/E)XK nuclease superfamily
MALYESCPRRFFYTHLLYVGGRRTLTDFMRMHEAVRTVFEAIVAGQIPLDKLEARIGAECDAQGLGGHGYAAEYQALAVTMIRFFISTRDGLTAETPVVLRLGFGDQEIIVRPDDVLVRGDGRRILRRVRTGHRRSAEADDVGAAAFLLAARQIFPDAEVELVHLADKETTPIDLPPKKLETRRTKLASFLAEIRAGCFPPKPSAWTCPGCPAFFICGPTPPGTLRKKF